MLRSPSKLLVTDTTKTSQVLPSKESPKPDDTTQYAESLGQEEQKAAPDASPTITTMEQSVVSQKTVPGNAPLQNSTESSAPQQELAHSASQNAVVEQKVANQEVAAPLSASSQIVVEPSPPQAAAPLNGPSEEQKPLENDTSENVPAFYDQETVYDTIAAKYNSSADPAIDYDRKEALMAFINKRCQNENLRELNDQFIALRKLDQFVLNLLKITYNGSTPQRAESLEKLREAIKQVYQQYKSGLERTPQSAEEEKAHQVLEKTAYQSLRDTELRIRNSITEANKYSWWNSTIGLIRGPAPSRVATQLEQASADSEAILGPNEAAPRPARRL